MPDAAEYLVTTQEEYRAVSAELEPGDAVLLARGVWRDFEILFEGQGTQEHPITLTAEEKGAVILSGRSNIRLAGDHLVVSRLVFRDGYTPTDSVIAFRRQEGVVANHSRVTETVIDGFSNPERFEPDYWVTLYGRHNRFDHNHLAGKGNKGVTLAVRLDSPASRQNHHRIDHNYFGPRSTLGSNGGETLRVGTSHYSLEESRTAIENNYFDRCNGEVEIVSIKSGANVVRGNVFHASRGTLTLRHGNDNRVEGNIFRGERVDHTGGIRVINKRQTIRNNYLEGLTGYRFGGAFVVMNGVPDSPVNRYHQVEGALIANNSIIDSEHIELAAGSDEERSAVPIDSRFLRNLIVNDDGRHIFSIHDDVSGIEFEGNVLHEVRAPRLSKGFVSMPVDLARAKSGLLFPADAALADVGAPRSLQVLSQNETGVAWYPKPEQRPRFSENVVIDVAPGVDSLSSALSALGDEGGVLHLAPGSHTVTRVLVVDRPVTVRAGGDARIDFERSALFQIDDGGSLWLQGLSISGARAPDYKGNAVVRTSRYSMLNNYELRIDDTDITDLDVNGFFDVLRVSKSTMADQIRITNSRFRDVSGSILTLDAETDDYGIYNAEYISIRNSRFENIAGPLVDVYRGGTDESTFGPHFLLLDSQLAKVGRGSRTGEEASLLLHGVQVARIAGNTFADSAPIRVFHTVGEPITQINGNSFRNTAGPVVVELNSDAANAATITNNTLTGSQSR